MTDREQKDRIQEPAPTVEELAGHAASAAGHLASGVGRLVTDVIIDSQKVALRWNALQLSVFSAAIRHGIDFARQVEILAPRRPRGE